MSDVLIVIGKKTRHMTRNDDEPELAVFVEGASANVYFNEAELYLERALKKMFG